MSVSRDAFLGGRLVLSQPVRGFRAGSDAVLLAAACPARPGQAVLDLGCGVGAAMYCLGARVGGLCLTGIERDTEAAALARANGTARVVAGDALHPPPEVRHGFDHVICNPPYFVAGGGSASTAPGREAAQREAGPGDLGRWVRAACKRAAPSGSVTFIARAERLPDLLGAMTPRLGALVIRPIAARAGQAAGRVIVQGFSGRRASLRLLAPLVLHSGAAHSGDRDDHTDEAQAILRQGAMLSM